jgi:hypothetical protein
MRNRQVAQDGKLRYLKEEATVAEGDEVGRIQRESLLVHAYFAV